MKVNTADLIGPALDLAVAKCEGFKKIYVMAAWSNKHGAHGGPQVMVSNEEDSSFDYRPSTIWSQGGPIIEQREIELLKWSLDGWAAKDTNYQFLNTPQERPYFAEGYGSTPLIAACRCLVASKLGDEVDIPEELLK